MTRRPTGMTAFIIVWLGQVVSLIGTSMTRFALIFWAYRETGQATALALVGFFAFGPLVLLSPIAGALGPLFGTGPGAGIGVLIAAAGVLSAVVGLGSYLFRAVRGAEELLPDAVQDRPEAGASQRAGDPQP